MKEIKIKLSVLWAELKEKSIAYEFKSRGSHNDQLRNYYEGMAVQLNYAANEVRKIIESIPA